MQISNMSRDPWLLKDNVNQNLYDNFSSDLKALELLLNVPCGEIVFSAAVSKVKSELELHLI